METLLYTRIRKPRGTIVYDDRFCRVGSGIRSDWSLGLSRKHVTATIVQLVKESSGDMHRGVLVGWDVAHDLLALGFEDAAAAVKSGERAGLALTCALPEVSAAVLAVPQLRRLESTNTDSTETEAVCDVVELQDFYRSSKGDLPVRLEEAFRETLQRDVRAHDAVEDARMTMELYLAWSRLGRPLVRYETDEVSITLQGVLSDFGVTYEILHPYGDTDDGRNLIGKSLATGTMLKFSAGRMQVHGQELEHGKLFYLRRKHNVIYLFTYEHLSRNEECWDGVQEVTAFDRARLDVVCCAFQKEASLLDGQVSFRAVNRFISASGIVLQEMLKDGASWIKVACDSSPNQPAGWVGPVIKGRRGCLRIVRPCPLELQLHCLQYDSFCGDALARLELLMELKPDRCDKTVLDENVEKDPHGLVIRYTLRFRDRSFRNAYLRTIQDVLKNRIALDTQPPPLPNKALLWTLHLNTSLKVGVLANASSLPASGCLVHIWDQPR